MTMTRISVALSLAIGAIASNAWAQAPATAPTQAPAVAPVAATPAQRAAIKELLDVTKARENLTRAFQALGSNLPVQMAQAMNARIEESSITPEQKQKVRDSMNQPFSVAVKDGAAIINDPKVIDQALEKTYAIYAKHFTTEEIKQLTAFYKSPVGTKSLAEMPQIVNETMQGGVSLFQPKLAALIDKTVKTQIDAVTGPAKK